MRRSWNGGLVEADGKFIGVYLGYDHCAEHEWGVKHLRLAFGLKDADVGTPELYGVESRRCWNVPPRLRLFQMDAAALKEEGAPDSWVLAYHYGLEGSDAEASRLMYDLHLAFSWVPDVRKDGKPCKSRKKKEYGDFACAWGSNDFAIRATRKEPLEELMEAFRRQDVLMQLGGPDAGNPFGGSGLTFGIISRMPQEYLDAMKISDQEKWEIEAYVRSTGIREAIAAAGKGYYTLAPRAMNDGTILFFLNPREQQKYNFGWFSIEDLTLWAKNEGPVIKEKVA